MSFPRTASLLVVAAFACSRAPAPGPVTPETAPPPAAPAPAPAPQPAKAPQAPARQRVVPPQIAFQLGLMPTASTGVSGWRLAHPTYDGRGVLIAILDSGVDPGIPGLGTTTTGDPKILDLRDVSGEGDVALTRSGDTWTGVLRELPFGDAPAADFDGNGSNRDSYRVEVTRDAEGWKARVDANRDGSLADEPWLRDYLAKRETFRFGPSRQGPITAAINLSEVNGTPHLAVYLETSSHGSHVAGIASGYNIYGVSGFNGVAPGAQIIGIRIANNARGGISTTGSMARAIDYAYRFAQERHLPLVMNMSFGVGNANEGRAAMDSIVDAFLVQHPDVFFAIAAGNDGPGMSTTGEPGSARWAVGVGATYPGSFGALQYQNPNDVIAWFSSRGGELAKPDIIAPGVAYSTVPEWNTGDEVKGGTSMATPYVSGMAALLISAMQQEQKPWTAASIEQALRAGARPLGGLGWVDQGPGLAQIEPAYQWLRAGHAAPRYQVEALPNAMTFPPGMMPTANVGAQRPGAPAAAMTATAGAYRRNGLAGDTIQRFRVSVLPSAVSGQPSASFRLTSDASWLRTVNSSVTLDARGSALIEVHYGNGATFSPGRYTGTITGWSTTDSNAGPQFTLLNTIIIPANGAISLHGQKVSAGQAGRFYVNVPEGSAGFTARLSARDTTMVGSVYLFEPTGRPARDTKNQDFGGENPRTVTAVVKGEDVVPGVWEVVVQAMPGKDVIFDLDAGASRARTATTGGITGAGALTLGAFADTTLPVSVELAGASLETDVTIERGAVLHLPLSAPSWAKSLDVEVEVTPDVWDQITDFAITVFDTSGAQIENGDMNYPFHRVTAELSENRTGAMPVVVDLFPAFANPVPPASVTAHVRYRFIGDPVPVVASAPFRVRPSGSVMPLPNLTPLPSPGAGDWKPLLRIRYGDAADERAAVQLLAVPAPR